METEWKTLGKQNEMTSLRPSLAETEPQYPYFNGNPFFTAECLQLVVEIVA
jgi:hypothetical protein